MNTLYPIFLNIENKPVLVVGGGPVAEQKIKGAAEAHANVTVIAPQASEIIKNLAGEGKIILHHRGYAPGDAKGFILVIGATDNKEVQEVIFHDAQREHIPVNIVDVPHFCTFFLSSLFQKGDLKIAVSTNGKSPTLGKLIRDKIQAEYSRGYPEVLETLGGMREEILRTFPDFESRKKMYERMVHTELERFRLHSGMIVNQEQEIPLPKGKVFLVGAGPGDPELMTVKGLRILHSAEVVLYDALVNIDILSHAPASCEKIYVGKRSGMHCTRQEEINKLLISKAREGKRIVRLKGGDPFIFGRGGEELEALQKAGIEVEAVPGITAGVGVSTSLGVPLTHRGESSSIVFVTGHEDPAKGEECVDWQSVSRIDTIVVYMGVKRLRFIVSQLIQHRVSPQKPVAVIYHGTLPGETVVTGVLEDIEEQTGDCSGDSPGLIIVGDVVRFLDGRSRHEAALRLSESLFQENGS
ncbi:MAG: uroporphyrinogen-III C-methyltransferase [Ignavibacteriae bacterium]|nr:MAG: uroporphyrinogen-III C-methyltransferase [Ignavibacteriota bacterium]